MLKLCGILHSSAILGSDSPQSNNRKDNSLWVTPFIPRERPNVKHAIAGYLRLPQPTSAPALMRVLHWLRWPPVVRMVRWMVRWIKWHYPPDTALEIWILAVWSRERCLSDTNASHNTGYLRVSGEETFVHLKAERQIRVGGLHFDLYRLAVLLGSQIGVHSRVDSRARPRWIFTELTMIRCLRVINELHEVITSDLRAIYDLNVVYSELIYLRTAKLS